MIARIRALLASLARRRASAQRFDDVLAQTVRDSQLFTLRLSTVERSVGLGFDRPQERAFQED